MEQHEEENKTKDKFKIIRLKVKEGTEYTQEQPLLSGFLMHLCMEKEVEKLKKWLAEVEAIKQVQNYPQDNEMEKVEAPSNGVIDEWKEWREKYLAREQVEVIDSL
eukprot:Gb_07037 [translate_table: standard]